MLKTENINRTFVMLALRDIRCEWQETAESQSLIDVNGSVGLLLYDVVQALQLTSDEAMSILGIDLFEQVVSIELEPISIQQVGN